MKAVIDELTECSRLRFHCPGCKCYHAVNIRLKNSASGPLWTWNGSLESPTISPSILVSYGDVPRDFYRPARCHSFIRDGKIEFCSDSLHELAGKTVELPPVTDND